MADPPGVCLTSWEKARDGYRAANAGALAAAAYPLLSAARVAGEGPLVSPPASATNIVDKQWHKHLKKLKHAMVVVIKSETSSSLHNQFRPAYNTSAKAK